MAKGKSKTPDNNSIDLRPGLTPEAEENQCIAMAYRLVKQRLADGSASSQETTHFLKMGSSKTRKEIERLEEENKLLRAKTEQIEGEQDRSELYAEVLKALTIYQGRDDESDDDEEY